MNNGEVRMSLVAGWALRRLIKDNYSSQEEFAFEFHTDIRTVSRYINQGIGNTDKIQELAEFFGVEFIDFFKE